MSGHHLKKPRIANGYSREQMATLRHIVVLELLDIVLRLIIIL